jgi:hypothetical protein
MTSDPPITSDWQAWVMHTKGAAATDWAQTSAAPVLTTLQLNKITEGTTRTYVLGIPLTAALLLHRGSTEDWISKLISAPFTQ